jgi:CBS domain-containing protein
MHAADIMTRELITVTPQTTLQEAVTLMLQHRISGLPVLSDSGGLVGIVTEGDLLRRTELGTERHLSRWSELLGSKQIQAEEYVHTHAQHIADVMTPHTIFVTPDASLNKVVALMETKHVKRLPVVQEGRLVGIVSRANLLRALLRVPPGEFRTNNDDEQIRRCIRAQIDRQPWAPRSCIRVSVHDGVAQLAGSILHEAERTALRVLTENTAGVKRVEDHLVWMEPLSGTIVELPKAVTDTPAVMPAPIVAPTDATERSVAAIEHHFEPK